MRCWLLISWKDSNWWLRTWCSRVSRGMYLENDKYSGIFTLSTLVKFELKQCTGWKTFRNQAWENLALVAKRGKTLPRVQDTKCGKDGLCQICKPTNLRTWDPFLPEKLLILHSRSRSSLSKFAGNITVWSVNKRRLTGSFAETRGYYL